MDKGQESSSDQVGEGSANTNNAAVAFHSSGIGNKATTEYFSNVKGDNKRKDKDKVEKRRIRVTRKTLFIIFGSLIGIIVVVMLVFVILNLGKRSTWGSRTEEELPTTLSEAEERAYKVVYSDIESGTAYYKEALYYVSNLLQDLTDANQDEDLIFAVRAFGSQLAYEGGSNKAISAAVSLSNHAKNDAQKYSIYKVLERIYNAEGDSTKVEMIRDLIDGLNIPENKIETVSGFGSAQEVKADETSLNAEANSETEAGNE